MHFHMATVVSLENEQIFKNNDGNQCVLTQRFDESKTVRKIVAEFRNQDKGDRIAIIRCLKCQLMALFIDKIGGSPVVDINGIPICPDIQIEYQSVKNKSFLLDDPDKE